MYNFIDARLNVKCNIGKARPGFGHESRTTNNVICICSHACKLKLYENVLCSDVNIYLFAVANMTASADVDIYLFTR